MASSAVTEIAKLRQSNEVDARTFCEAVQKAYRGSAPAFQVIAQAVRKKPNASVQEIAHYIGLHPPTPKSQHSKQSKNKSGRTGGIDLADHVARSQNSSWTPSSKNPLRSRNRVAPERSRTCPHGIPYFRKCGICNHDVFKEMTGI